VRALAPSSRGRRQGLVEAAANLEDRAPRARAWASFPTSRARGWRTTAVIPARAA
jgi:hypothetical protein